MGESRIDHFLASRTPFIHFKIVFDALFMEKMRTRKIGAHDSGSELLIAR